MVRPVFRFARYASTSSALAFAAALACIGGGTAALAQDGSFRWSYVMESTSKYPLIESSPAVADDGTIYVGVVFATSVNSGALVALTPVGDTDVREKWRFKTPVSLLDAGIEASPLVGPDGTIFVGSFDGKFYAIDKTNGQSRWMYDTNTATALPTYIHSSAALSRDGQTIYVGVGTLNFDGPGIGALYALTIDGHYRWSHWFGGTIEASPVVGEDGTIYVGSWDNNFYAINPDGSEKWHRAMGGAIDGSAAIGGDGTIYIGCAANQFIALTPGNQIRWQMPLIVLGSAAVGADGTVYVGSYGEGRLYALDPRDNVQDRIKWAATAQPGVGATPTVRGDGTIILGGEDGVIRAYDPASGSIKWSYSISTGGRVNSSPLVVPASGHGIYVGATDGRLYALRGNTSPLSAYSSWPTFQHDVRHTGQADERISGGRLVNLATRGIAGPSTNLIAGFVVEGSGVKPLLVRAVGPTLSLFNISAPMPNPALTIRTGSTILYTNDDWGLNADPIGVAAVAASVGAFSLPIGSKDAALLASASVTVPTTTYTAAVDAADGASGVTLVETYDADPQGTNARLVNLSTRGRVGTGENVLIPSLVIGGPGKMRVLIRAVGPGLAGFNVSGVLAQPAISVYNSVGQLLGSNIGWTSGGLKGDILGAGSLVGAFPLSESDADSAMILSLDPGAYTFQVSGVGGGTGEALVEVYALPH